MTRPPTCLAYLQQKDLTNLAKQLIPTMLGIANYALGSCIVPVRGPLACNAAADVSAPTGDGHGKWLPRGLSLQVEPLYRSAALQPPSLLSLVPKQAAAMLPYPCLQPEITGNVSLANSLVGDRVIPPVGDGLCACCSTSACNTVAPPSVASVCNSSSQGCVQLTYPNISAITLLIGNWSAQSECGRAIP